MSYIRENWLGLLGLVVGILGVVMSIYFYKLTEEYREPTITETNNFAIFASPEGLNSKKFAFVKKPELTEISENVYVNEISIWNAGKLPIKEEHILKDIKISYAKEVQIIDVFISESSRPDIVNPFAKKAEGKNVINIGFDILEENNGFKLQVIYASKEKQNFSIQGVVEGVDSIRTESDLTKSNIYFAIGKIITYVFLFLLFFLVVGLITHLLETFYEKEHSPGVEKTKKFVSASFWTFVIVSGVSAFTLLGYSKVMEYAKEESKTSVPTMEQVTLNQVAGGI